jgi:hypothetical protein
MDYELIMEPNLGFTCKLKSAIANEPQITLKLLFLCFLNIQHIVKYSI